MVSYFWNGRRLTEGEAFSRILNSLGCSKHSEFTELWATRFDSEESRDALFVLSGYNLEIEFE